MKIKQNNLNAQVPFLNFFVSGQRFAIMEEKIIISQILRKFKVKSLDKTEDITVLAELVLRPKDNLRMVFEPR